MSALARLEIMPAWPIRMTADVAALYMCVSKTTFLARFGAMGVKESGNVFWSRDQLDRHVAKQFALKQPRARDAEGDDTWDDLR